MGGSVCHAISADPDLELVAAVDPVQAGEQAAGGVVIEPGPEALEKAGAQVAVDFTIAPAAHANALWCAEHGVHAVIGTTGMPAGALQEIERRFDGTRANCIIAPNFAIGAVLMMRFAELAAPWFDSVEVIELHHDAKLDAPSGTALLTARRIGAARSACGKAGFAVGKEGSPGEVDFLSPRGAEVVPGVRVHSVRLRGLVAHQEVLFGTAGQTLTIRHDSLDRGSFMPGVLLAVKQVPNRPGLTLGLDALLGL
jgi:4-hydroxy-tetrahydrodipicolinate reductase